MRNKVCLSRPPDTASAFSTRCQLPDVILCYMPSAELSSRHIAEAHRQIEQALQTADQQIEALKARVTKKHAQLSSAKLQLEHLREDMQDVSFSQRHAPPSLPDTESSEQTGGLC